MNVYYTFSRDLKFNPHIHMLVSRGGITLNHARSKEIGKKLKSAKKAATYIGRYTKRTPIATTRISSFIDHQVTFWFQDHHTQERITWTLPSLEFIARLIPHIHDHHFKQIRYSGFLAN
jgi:hypothetical protein